jgi:hypothetical protein
MPERGEEQAEREEVEGGEEGEGGEGREGGEEGEVEEGERTTERHTASPSSLLSLSLSLFPYTLSSPLTMGVVAVSADAEQATLMVNAMVVEAMPVGVTRTVRTCVPQVGNASVEEEEEEVEAEDGRGDEGEEGPMERSKCPMLPADIWTGGGVI